VTRSVRLAILLSLATAGAVPAAPVLAANPPSDPIRAARTELARARATHPGDHPAVADACATLGDRLIAARALDEAGAPIREGYEMRRRLHGDGDLSVALSLHQLGELAGRRGRLTESLAFHEQALAIRRRALGPGHPDVANSLKLTSRAYTALSDWGRGEALLRGALAIERRALRADDPRIAGTLLALGDNLRWQNELPDAEEMLREAVVLLGKSRRTEGSLAGALEALAMLHRFKAEHDLAEPLLLRSIGIRRRLYGEAGPSVLVGRANLALNHAYQGRREEADREFKALRDVVANAPAGTDLTAIGDLLDGYMMVAAESASDWPAAERYGRASLAAMERKGHDAEITTALRHLGQARAAQGDPADAERYLERSAAAYERARLKMTPGLKMASFKKTPYEQLALLRLENGRPPGGAWEALEAARARVLADQLAARGTGRGEAGDATKAGAGGAPHATKPLPLPRIQAGLRRDQAIVAWLDGELYPGALRSWACVIRKRGPPRWVRLPARGDIAALSTAFRGLRDRMEGGAASPVGASDRSWMPDARALWRTRFAPLERHLGGVRELVLIPSWAMGSFPVDMLLDGRERPVGDRFAIVHAPSATVHALLRTAQRGRPGAPRTALLVGDPPFRRDSQAGAAAVATAGAAAGGVVALATLRSAMRGDARAIGTLPRLMHSRDEVAGIARLLPESRVLLEAAASEAAVDSLARCGAMSRFQVVHFATHALIDHERPHRSGLVLSQSDRADLDGIVTGDEIAGSWHLDASLVTLSACQTAIGRTVFGEGVVGLSYPIFRAGARSLLVSQWKVDDAATALLMKRFYGNWLGRGAFPWLPRMSKAEALREAKRWLREYRDAGGRRPFAHPVHWAAFVLVGDPG
jgi:CHAT domain-containing protein/tetratricopeptide (TPR) repeat protein